MARHSASVDRMVRLELLRARAALEREALAQGIVEAGRTLTPSNMVKSIWPSLGKANTSRLFWQAFALVRRYPFVSSTLSAMVMGRGARRSRLLAGRRGAGGLAGIPDLAVRARGAPGRLSQAGRRAAGAARGMATVPACPTWHPPGA